MAVLNGAEVITPSLVNAVAELLRGRPTPSLYLGPLAGGLALRVALADEGLLLAEPSTKPRSIARQSRSGAGIVRAARDRLPLPRRSLAALVAFDNLGRAEPPALLASWCEALTPGGLLVVAERPRGAASHAWARAIGGPRHRLPPERMTQLLLHQGFDGIGQRWPDGGAVVTFGALRLLPLPTGGAGS